MPTLNEFDVETGALRPPPPPRQLVRAGIWAVRVISLLLLVSLVQEYYQEYVAIQELKTVYALTPDCLASAPVVSDSWLDRWAFSLSGLERAHDLIDKCDEQRRVNQLLPLPNPLIVIVKLFWRTFIGENAGHALTVLLSEQTYLVQLCVTVTATVTFCIIVYQFAMHIPSLIYWTLTHRHAQQQAVYEDAQRDLRGQQSAPRDEGVRRRRAAKEFTQNVRNEQKYE